jgi:hypothetical protein
MQSPETPSPTRRLAVALQNGTGALIARTLTILFTVIGVLGGAVIKLQLNAIEFSTRRTDERLSQFEEAVKGLRQEAKESYADIVVLRVDMGALTARLNASDQRLGAAEKRLEVRP